MKFPNTLGALKESGYISKSIKDEMRDNLTHALKNNIDRRIDRYPDNPIPVHIGPPYINYTAVYYKLYIHI